VKGISVRHPWAWALVYGGKTVENRGQATFYQGPLAIHASGTWDPAGARDPRILAAFAPHLTAAERAACVIDPAKHPDLFPFGAVIAAAQLTDCHWAEFPDRRGGPTCCKPWGELVHVGPKADHRAWHYVPTDVRPLTEPVPCRGALGVWTVPPAVLAAITHHLGGSTC
jgi:hypothetical protein